MNEYKGKSITINETTYLLDDEIDQGGNSSVYKATVPNDSRVFAIKILQTTKSKEKKERFLKEISFCENVTHPNIVPIYGHGEIEKHLCYAMPLYPKTLRHLLNVERDYVILLDVILQLCHAIKYVHSQSIIHRDIKPENIFVAEDGTVVLADFGIAHFYAPPQSITTGWLGNKSYAAPEQLIKESDIPVSTASDIYALGKIINEIFTKENPSGSHYRKAFDVDPMLSSIDWIVDSCMSQNPADRPTVDEVQSEVQFISEKLAVTLTELQSALLYNEDTDLPEELVDRIALKASKDVLIAKNIFENTALADLDKINCNYHKNIHFSADEMLKDIYFQELAYHYCWRKFVYEAQVYQRGSNYTPLNLDDPTEKELYHSFETIAKRHHNGHIRNNLTNELLKIFASCCNYHCEELLSRIKALEKELSDFDDAPIMYIVYRLRHALEQHCAKDIDLAETISINWNATEYDDSVEPLLFRKEIDKSETDVMAVFQSNWDIVYRKIDDSHYLVRFNSSENFDNFKKHALTLSAPHYIFEGDVQYILSNPQHYANMVELRPLSSFDITNTIARILGIRTEQLLCV